MNNDFSLFCLRSLSYFWHSNIEKLGIVPKGTFLTMGKETLITKNDLSALFL